MGHYFLSLFCLIDKNGHHETTTHLRFYRVRSLRGRPLGAAIFLVISCFTSVTSRYIGKFICFLPNYSLTMWLTVIVYLLLLCGFLDGMMNATLDTSRNLATVKMMNMEQSRIEIIESDINLNPLQMIRKEGYPAEAHIALTSDGYLLTLHRIPGVKDSPPVLLQHGLLCSSADWIISGKGKGLAYILADNGYDVWLGNFRGNTYSRAHISLSPSDSQFWDFSFHELGVYDIPAMIEYIMSKTSQLLHMYVGHSMGTTAFYVMALEVPQLSQMVRVMVSFAPVAFVEHIQSPIRYFAPFAKDYEIIAHFLGKDEFLPQNSVLKCLARHGCDTYLFQEKICANILFLICGFDKKQFNYSLLPVILSHDPAGASTKTLVHFSQLIESGKFRQYDYGTEKNLVIYNATEPPDYKLENITVPMILFYADNDWLSSVPDVKRLYNSLFNKVYIYRVPLPTFNHLDYIWGKDAPKLVYKKLLEYMKNEEPKMLLSKMVNVA